MAIVKKAFKFRIYPNKEQVELINKTFGCCRFVFNFVLAKQKKEESYWDLTNQLVQNGMLISNEFKSKYFNKVQSIKDIVKLKKYYDWLKEVDSIALQASVEDVADAYSSFYKKKSKKPKFKSKNNPVQSYTTKVTNNNIEVLDKHIKLPKLGFVKYANSKKVEGKLKRVTIKLNPAGKYYISILVETEINELPKSNSTVGIDVGLKFFATLSNGKQVKNPRFLSKLETKLAKEQKILSKRTIGSSNWKKQKIKVARIHEKITNKRLDFLHKLSTEIIKNHDIIGIEDLKVSKMLKEKAYSKAISEVSWYQFRLLLEYKAEWYGKKLVPVDPYKTSQCCNKCKYTNKENRVSQSVFLCKSCGHKDHADHNASKNIEELALVA